MTEQWTVKRILDWTIPFFEKKAIPESRLSAELLLAEVLHCTRLELYVQFERFLTPHEREHFRNFVTRRAAGEPVQYILGHTSFMGLDIRVGPGVLIPRSETEILVDCVLEHLGTTGNQPQSVLDIGSGSGCIAIALSKLANNVRVSAVEKSPTALEIARENARILEAPVTWIAGDFFEQLPHLAESFDIVVSNPPYVTGAEWQALETQVRDFEPKEALVGGGPDGLGFYRDLAAGLDRILNPGGAIFLETGHQQAKAVAAILEARELTTAIRRDYSHIERVVIGKR